MFSFPHKMRKNHSISTKTLSPCFLSIACKSPQLQCHTLCYSVALSCYPLSGAKIIVWELRVILCVQARFVRVCVFERERERHKGKEEQQNLPSSMCFTSSPINHDPLLTSSLAYAQRIDLENQRKMSNSILPGVSIY